MKKSDELTAMRFAFRLRKGLSVDSLLPVRDKVVGILKESGLLEDDPHICKLDRIIRRYNGGRVPRSYYWVILPEE